MRLTTTLGGALCVLLVCVPKIASAVEGGTIDRTTSHSVGIARANPSQASVTCSGTLVSSNIVLTVRHCISPLNRASEKPCDATFGAPDDADTWVNVSPWTDGAGARWKHVKAVRVPETNELCGDDIALLVLEELVNEGEAVPARPIVDEASFLRIANADRRIGISAFGVTGAALSDSGTRRSRHDIPIECIPSQSAFLCGPELDFIGSRELTTGSGPCRGDSGAGAIAASDPSVILGVLSRGDRGVDGLSCSLGVFERTDAWAWLIARTVIDEARSGSFSPPTWAADLFPSSPTPGQFCKGAATCSAGTQCASIDGKRSWKCVTQCSPDGQCAAAGDRCEQGICVPAVPQPASSSPPSSEDEGCSVTRTNGGHSFELVFLALLTLAAHRKSRT